MRSIKLNKKIKIIIASISIILLLIVIILLGIYSKLSKIKTTPITANEQQLNVNQDVKNDSINNYLILTTTIDPDENSCDLLMIGSINNTEKKLKIASILRDLDVDNGPGNLNSLKVSPRYGGMINTIKVVNKTFNMDITNYVILNFNFVVKVVDAIGGVDLNLSEQEINGPYATNERASNLAEIMNVSPPPLLTTPGLNHLNGIQAAGYARVRVIDSDFQRTNRERILMKAVIDKVQKMPLTEINKISNIVLENIETSIPKTELLSMCQDIILYYKNGFDETSIPVDGTWKHSGTSEFYYIDWDKDSNIKALHDFIFGK